MGAAAGTSAGDRSSLDGTRMGRLIGATSVEGGSTCVGVSVTGVESPACNGPSTGVRSPVAPPVTGTSRIPRDGRETAPVAGVPSLAPPAGFKACGKRSRPFQPLVRLRSRSNGTPGCRSPAPVLRSGNDTPGTTSRRAMVQRRGRSPSPSAVLRLVCPAGLTGTSGSGSASATRRRHRSSPVTGRP